MQHISDLLIKVLADYLVVPIVLIGALALWRLPEKVRYQRCARAVLAGIVALLFDRIASLLYQGQRPFVAMGVAPKAAFLADSGFPSDHVVFCFIITFIVWAATKNLKLSILLFVLSCLVGLGRVLALVHRPIDVLGGIGCALLAAIVVYGRKFFDRDLPSSQSF